MSLDGIEIINRKNRPKTQWPSTVNIYIVIKMKANMAKGSMKNVDSHHEKVPKNKGWADKEKQKR
jgi:hypothetical protein